MITFIKKRRWDIAACTAIALIIFALGSILGAWSGYLKGDDAYYHVARVQYILQNFPHISWYSQYFCGYDPFGFEPPFIYFVIAIAHRVTSLPVVSLYQITMCLSMIGFGIAIYLLSRFLKLARLLATAFALLPFTIPEVWNWLVIGGAYLRIPALAFFVLSILTAFRHITEINRGSEHRSTYVLNVLVLALLASIHPLLWQWDFLILSAAYLFGIAGWRGKILNSIKVFGPVALITAWQYIPLLKQYMSEFIFSTAAGSSQYTVPLAWNWLVYIPSPFTWSNSLGPAVLPLAFFLLGWAILKRINKHPVQETKTELLFAVILGLFSVYFFMFGWLRMPTNLYLMASYDYCFFLGISLVLFSVFICSIMIRRRSFDGLPKYLAASLQMIFATSVVIGNLVVLPFLDISETMRTPAEPQTISAALKSVVDVAENTGIAGYRIQTAQRLIESWAGLYPYIVTTGGRSKNDAPHKYYNQWGDAIVSYGYDFPSIGAIYSDDAPLVLRPPLGGKDNFYSSMFWLDWFGAAGPVLSYPFYPQGNTSAAYSARPQFFEKYASATGFGDLYFFKYLDASPIVTSSQAAAVAVPYQTGEAPAFYTDFLDVMSSLNLNSQWVIPVKLDDAGQIETFNTAVVDYADYIQHKDLLDAYASGGGHLVVIGQGSGEAAELSAQLVGLGTSIQIVGSPLAAPQGSTILAETSQGPLVYRYPMGQGAVTVMGTTLGDILKGDSTMAAVLLAEAISTDSGIKSVSADLSTSFISVATGGSDTYLVSYDGAASLSYAINSTLDHNQFNWTFPLPESIPVDSNAVLNFSLWSDGSPVSWIGVTLQQGGEGAYLGYNLPAQTWDGWKDFSLPLSYFQWMGGDLITSFNDVSICFNDNAPYDTSQMQEQFKVKDLNLSVLDTSLGVSAAEAEWLTADTFRVTLGDTKTILWKESYMPSWQVVDDQGRPVKFYFAGPGMIYLKAPADARYITFHMPEATDRMAGLIISGISLLAFGSWGLIAAWRRKRA
jgi:hypothetical protein